VTVEGRPTLRDHQDVEVAVRRHRDGVVGSNRPDGPVVDPQLDLGRLALDGESEVVVGDDPVVFRRRKRRYGDDGEDVRARRNDGCTGGPGVPTSAGRRRDDDTVGPQAGDRFPAGRDGVLGDVCRLGRHEKDVEQPTGHRLAVDLHVEQWVGFPPRPVGFQPADGAGDGIPGDGPQATTRVDWQDRNVDASAGQLEDRRLATGDDGVEVRIPKRVRVSIDDGHVGCCDGSGEVFVTDDTHVGRCHVRPVTPGEEKATEPRRMGGGGGERDATGNGNEGKRRPLQVRDPRQSGVPPPTVGGFLGRPVNVSVMRDVLAEWRPVVDAAIEELLPRDIDDDYLTDFFGEATYRYHPGAMQRALADPIWELLDRGGKRWRAILFLIFVDAFGEEPEDYLPYATIPEILHNGTIIVDDVEDRARMRRGESALHHEHGTDIALNAGNAMYFIPLKVIDRDSADLPPERRLQAYEMLTHELNRTHLGQGMDICWHNQKEVTVDEEQYFEMCACKTGCLARIVARLAAIVTGQSDDVEQAAASYAEDMSVAFQIGDDILDIENTLDQAGDFGKEFGNDIREGKKTLMVIHAADTADPEDVARLEQILWAEENDDDEILEAIDIMQSVDAVDYARDRAYELSARARSHLDRLDLEPEPEEQLREFSRFVIEREA